MRKIITFYFVLLVGLLAGQNYALAQSYCASNATSTGDTEIDAVTLVGESVTISTNTTSQCATYTDFTAQTPADLFPGETYEIVISLGSCSSTNYSKSAKAYIDWNGDYDFDDAGEELGATSYLQPAFTETITFTVPVNANLGDTRLRVVCEETSASGITACGTYSYGETEDYTVSVMSSYDCDLMAYAWVSPNLMSNDLTATEQVSVTVKNVGQVAQSGYTLSYSIDNGVNFSTDIISTSLAPGATYTHTFSSTADFSTTGMYDCVFEVGLNCDSNLTNNTLAVQVENSGSVSTFPFFDNFDGTSTDWVAGGTNSSWAWGVPDASVINSAASPTNAWVTNLTGLHNSSEYSWVQSPVFNFTTLTAPIVEMKIWYNTETGLYDGGALQYSTDGGATWNHVGAAFGVVANDPNATNWYNGTSIQGLNYTNGWYGNSNGWVNVKYNLYDNTGLYTNLAGQSSVMFRVLFGSDASGNNNGFAFDDFLVYQAPDNDAGIVSINSLTAVCAGSVDVIAQIKNFGALALTSATVNWTVNGVAQTPVTFTGNLAPNTQTDITLGSYTFLSGTVYDVQAYTTLPNGVADQIAFNDTSTVSGFMTSLDGTYTIGGTSGDFATVVDAVDALNLYGVCGPTTFEIAAGTYTGRVELGNLVGISATNTVTFTSASGNASDVVVSYGATGTADNAVWYFNGASYINVEAITIKSTASGSYGRVVVFEGGANNNTVSDCVIESVPVTSSLAAPVYSTSGSADNFNTIQDNHLKYGYYGIYFYASSSNYEQGNKFLGNYVEEAYYYGIYNYYQNELEVRGNFVYQTTPLGGTTFYPIRVGYSPGVQITHNKVQDMGGSNSYGIDIYYCNSPSTNMALVANNMVSSEGMTGTVRGIYLYYSNYVKAYHNSIHLTSGGTTYGMYLYAGTAATNAGNYFLVNNSVVNNAGGTVYYWNEAAFLSSSSSFNNLYTSGSTFATIVASPNVTVTDLAQWQLYAPNDQVSVGNPYLGTHDLHSNSPLLNAAATPVSEVTDDYDGDPRNATTPDIGADEFTPITDDAGVTAFVGIDATCPGVADIEVTVNNFGMDPLATVTINCEINGVALTPYVHSDTIPVGGSENIVIGSYTFNANTPYDFVAWTSSPNGVADLNTSNDTLYYYGMQTAIFGNYTIGATGDFPNIDSAVTFMSTYGICGPVVFDIQSGVYEGQITIPSINGADSINTITFQSETGNNSDVVIQYAAAGSTDNWVWSFNGADYVTLQNVTVTSTTTTNYGRVIVFENGAHYNQVLGSKINSLEVTSSLAAGIYSTSGSQDNYNTIANNEIFGGYYNIYFYGSSSNKEVGNKFLNNKVYNYYMYGTYVYYNDFVEVHGNTVLQNPTSTASNYPIYVYYCDSAIRVTNNYIYDDNGSYFYGLRVYYCDASANARGLVANNMVAVDGVATTNYGLYVYYTMFFDIFHNSVLLNSGSTNYGIYFAGTAANNPGNFKNNSVVVTPNTTGSRAIYSTTSFASTANEFSNNNWYSNGPNLAYWGGTNYADIAAWSAFYPGDVVSTDGGYYATDDLHTNSILLDGAGLHLPEVPFDFDGDPRDPFTPDIGADEFLLVDLDMEVLAVHTLGGLPLGAGDEHVVSAVVRNFGLLSQTNVPVTLSITGANTFTATDTIASTAPGQVDTLYFEAFTATTLGWNTVSVSVPTDDNNANNEMSYAQEVSENVFAYADTMSADGNVGVNDADGHIYWNKHYMAELALVTNVRVYISGDPNNVGQTVHAAVMNAAGVIVDYSQALVLDNSHLNSWVTFYFDDPSIISFSNEHFYVGFVMLPQTGASFSPLGYQTEEILRSDAYFVSDNWDGSGMVASMAEQRFMIAAVIGEPAPLDASASQLINPAGGCGTGVEDIVFSVKNNGTDSIFGFTVGYEIDGVAGTPEVVSGVSLAPGDIYEHTFANSYDFTALVNDTTFDFVGWVTMTGDTVNTNDTIFVTVESLFTPAAPITNTQVTAILGYPYTLTATSPYTIFWFEDPNLPWLSYGTGSFTTPPLWDSTYTYWVSASTSSEGTFTLFDNSTPYSTTTNNPIGQFWTSQTMQYVVLASDMAAEGMMAGDINSVAFNVSSPAGAPLQDYTIKMGHTSLNAMTSNASDWNTNMTTVYNSAAHTSFVGWNEFEFTTPFTWNGVDNLVVQFCFSNGTSNYTSNGELLGETMSYNTSVGWYTDGAFSCDAPSSYYVSTFMPQLMFNAGVAGCESELVEITINVIKPPYDALINDMLAPAQGCGVFVENPMFEMTNNGSETITTFDFSYQVNGGQVYTETVSNVSILSDSSYTYTFNTPFDFTAPVGDSIFDISAWVTLANDTINFNDTLNVAFESLFTPDAPIPFNTTTVFGNTAEVSVSTLGNVIWYDDQAGTNMLAIGDTFYVTPVLFDTTSYWAVATSGAEGDILIGDNTTTASAYSSLGNPYGQYYTSVQTQFLITADDLIAQGFEVGDINSVSLSATSVAGAPLQNFSISMAHTSLTSLTATAASWTTNLQTVYTNPSYTTTVGWNLHEFATPFYWNGVDNIVIQYCFSNGTSNWTTSAIIEGMTVSGIAGIGQSTDGTFTCGAPSSYSSTNFFPQQKFNVTMIGCESEPVEVFAYVTNIPSTDAGVNMVNSPVSGIELPVSPVVVMLENLGTQDQTNFLITYEFSDGVNPPNTVTEQVTSVVPAGGTLLYEFNTLADVSAFGTYDFCVYTGLVNDMYSPNDTVCWTVVNDPLQYCTSNALYTGYEEIVEVGFGSFVNNSGPAFGSNYQDFTTLGPIAAVTPGMIVPISIATDFSPGFSYNYTCYVKVFIDWNHDGVYDPVTEVAYQSQTVSSNTVTGNVSVPVTAVPGNSGMRVVFSETSIASNVQPCGTYSYGETEDYLLEIGQPDPWDAALTAILEPTGTLQENATSDVIVTVYNLGLETITGMDISYSIDGGPATVFNFTDTLVSFQSADVNLGNMTVPGGFFDLCAWTTLLNDSNTINDSTCVTLFATPQFDLAMVDIIAPEDGCDLGLEDVIIEFENLGDTIVGGVTLGYFHNNNTTPTTEVYGDTIFPGDVVTYTFITPVDLTVTIDTEFQFSAFVSYGPDPVYQNDTLTAPVNSYLSPDAPDVDGATIWASEFVTLSVNNPDTNMFYSWYSAADTTLINQGPEYTTPALFDTTQYLVSAAAGGGSGSLTTTFTTGNGQSGNMFNVTALTGNITIESFDINFDNTTQIDVYYRAGGYQGFETNIGAWTLMGSVASLVTNGTDVPTPLPVGGLTIPYGETYGILIVTYNTSMNYNTLTSPPYHTDGNILIDASAGTTFPLGTVYTPRDWSGTIYYSSGNGCNSEFTPVAVNVQYADYDAGIVEMISPTTGAYLGFEDVTVVVYNNGLNAISNTPISYTINGGGLVSQVIPDTIQPGDSLIFTFTQPADLNIVPANYDICVSVDLPNDGYALNDELCEMVTNMDGDGLTCASAFPYGEVNDPAVVSATTFAYDVEWWEFTATVPYENVSISLCGSSFDTQVSYWLDCSDVVFTAQNDDYCGAQSQIDLTGILQPGTYYVRVYGYSTAYGNFTLNITGDVVSKFIVDLSGTDILCNGDATGAITTSLLPGPAGTAAALPVTYEWSSGQTSANVNGLTAGTYTVTATDATGWQEVVEMTLTEPTAMAITGTTVDNTVIGGNIGEIDITVSGGTAGYSYDWANGGTTEDMTALYAGVYAVTVTDGNSCTMVEEFTVHSPSPWTVNPTPISHNIVIPQNAIITLDALALPPGSFVGVFYDSLGVDVCGGWAYWSGMNTVLTAYGTQPGLNNGFAPGETFQWRVYHAVDHVDYAGTADYNTTTYLNAGNFVIGGLSGIYEVEAFSIITQTIDVPEGWCLWSTYIDPTNPNIENVMADIATLGDPTSQAVITKSYTGDLYWPGFFINTIGNIVIGQGYQTRIQTTNGNGTEFGVTGLKLDAPSTTFPIVNGWSLIAYLKDVPSSIAVQFAAYAQAFDFSSPIEIIKNGAGDIFWPQFNIVTISQMNPGEGYQIKNRSGATINFTYPSANFKSDSYTSIVSEPVHYNAVENTGKNMTLGIPAEAWTVEPMIGDEVGVFDPTGKLIGASVFEGGFTPVTIWGKEVMDESKDKGSNGMVYSIRLYQQATGLESEVVVNAWEQGSDVYSNDAIAVASKVTISGGLGQNYALGQNMPNPFKESTIIPFYVPVDCEVNIVIYNSLGEQVKEVYKNFVPAGNHEARIETYSLPSGNYFYKFITDEFTDVRSMTINK